MRFVQGMGKTFVTLFPANAPAGFYVRVVVVYQQPDSFMEIVERCPNHLTEDKDGEIKI